MTAQRVAPSPPPIPPTVPPVSLGVSYDSREVNDPMTPRFGSTNPDKPTAWPAESFPTLLALAPRQRRQRR